MIRRLRYWSVIVIVGTVIGVIAVIVIRTVICIAVIICIWVIADWPTAVMVILPMECA